MTSGNTVYAESLSIALRRASEAEQERDTLRIQLHEVMEAKLLEVANSEWWERQANELLARLAKAKAGLEQTYSRIAHGDDAHRAWLKAEIDKIVAEALS